MLSIAGDIATLSSSYVRMRFNLTRGSLDSLQGRVSGDGEFSSASPNVVGALSPNILEPRRGGLAVTRSGTPGVLDSSTSDFDRATPLVPTVIANNSEMAAFSVVLGDQPQYPLLLATLTFTVAAAWPRALLVNVTAVAQAPGFSASRVALSSRWMPADAVAWYERGVRQGMDMPSGNIASASPLSRFYAIGNGSEGAIEILLPDGSGLQPSSLLAGNGSFESGAKSGLDVSLWGAPAPLDQWVNSFDAKVKVSLPPGATSRMSMLIFPNNYAFPPSQLDAPSPGNVSEDDLATILVAAHGSAASALHSYDFYPEVRAAPCLVHAGNQCYAPNYNFYDPDSAISNSAMLYSFDPMLHETVRGQLETNMVHVCGAGEPSDRCEEGQCIHHFVGSCDSKSPECVCETMPSGVTDCFVYDALSGAVQTGPNVFTLLAAIRYAGVSGNLSWLQTWAPTMRNMMGFLDARYYEERGLYLAPGSLQIDVFIRQNFTSDSNAAMVLLTEAFADMETALGNSSGAAIYMQRASDIRSGMIAYLSSPEGDHFCTQSDPSDPRAPGTSNVTICSRDFVDYDANLLAVAARVPTSNAHAERILARIDGGACAHKGRATYVSEIQYNASNCVNGNIGDSAVTMGRIAWQDGLARQAIGGPVAAAAFESLILGPLQADVLSRTWLPERFDCLGRDAHNQFYFEYASVASMLIFEVRYGIKMLPASIVVDPIGAAPFFFALSSLRITYNQTNFMMQLPPAHRGIRLCTVKGVSPGLWRYGIGGQTVGNVSVSQDATLSFTLEDVSKGGIFAELAV